MCSLNKFYRLVLLFSSTHLNWAASLISTLEFPGQVRLYETEETEAFPMEMIT